MAVTTGMMPDPSLWRPPLLVQPVWQRNAPLPLGTPLDEVGSAGILFLHDLAVRDGLKSPDLVAVEGAPEIAARVADYGPGASWMGRMIG